MVRDLADSRAAACFEAPRPGAHGTQVAFLHPKATGGTLTVLLVTGNTMAIAVREAVAIQRRLAVEEEEIAQKEAEAAGCEVIALTPKHFDTLLFLVENAGEVLEKDRIMGAVWPRMVVEEKEPTGDEDADFQDMLRKFKQGVAQNVEEEDHESHYDLGVAYKEMGLLDDALHEFETAGYNFPEAILDEIIQDIIQFVQR